MPEESRLKRYYQTSNQRGSYSSTDFTKSRYNRKVKNPVTDEGLHTLTTKQTKPKKGYRQPPAHANTSKVVVDVQRRLVGRHNLTSAPFKTEEGKTLQSLCLKLLRKAHRHKNLIQREVVSKAKVNKRNILQETNVNDLATVQNLTKVVEVTMLADERKAKGMGERKLKIESTCNLTGRYQDHIVTDLGLITNTTINPMSTVEAELAHISKLQKHKNDLGAENSISLPSDMADRPEREEKVIDMQDDHNMVDLVEVTDLRVSNYGTEERLLESSRSC